MRTLREYADWLTANEDPRGEYLTAELDLRDAEATVLRLESRIYELTEFRGVDSEWMDTVFPLTVQAPVVGTFFAAPTPGAPPFVKPGDVCLRDTIVGIIEAMDLFNEIPAGRAGVVTKVLVSNGQPVRHGDPLVQLSRPPQLLAGG